MKTRTRKCKYCKDPFEVFHFNQKNCLKDPCRKQMYIDHAVKQKREWKKENKTVHDLLSEVQEVFNEWIRLRDARKPCISCQNTNPKKVNAGHYFSSGGHKAVTFDPDNVHLQCEHCNTYLSGNLIEYRKGLIERIGIERFEALESRAYGTAKYSRHELIELKESVLQMLKNVKKDEQ